MRITIFAALYYPFRGGYVESIHELVKRLFQKEHEVTVITCNTHRVLKEEIIDGIKIIRLSCINPRWLNNTFPIPIPSFSNIKTIKSSLRNKPDIISTQTRFFPTTCLGFLIAKSKHIPIVHTERGSTRSIVDSGIIRLMAILIDHTIGWVIARFSTATVGVSEASCKFLRHLGAKNPVKVYNGVDADFWRKVETYHHPKIKERENIIITFVGRLIYAKGVQDLLQAIRLTINKMTINCQLSNVKCQMLHINIIGDGPYRPALEKLAQKLGIQNQVYFLGEMTREQIREILWQTDIFVNPSHSEGLPRAVLEAAAVGLPIIATDVGGTREIIDENCGLLAPPRNTEKLSQAIYFLLNSPEARKKMGDEAQSYVKQNFDWKNIAREYLQLFEELSSGNSAK